MKTTLLTLALCSCLLVWPTLASPAGPIDEDAVLARIAASPSLKNAADEDAVILYEGDFIDYEDGLAIWRHQELIKLYSEYAIEHLGDPRVAWDSSRQKLEIHANRSYLTDGSALDAPKNAHNEVTPNGLDLAVDFLDIREMVVSRVGLERGVTVWLDYTIRDLEPGWLPYTRLIWPNVEWPVLEREIGVSGGLTAQVVHPEWSLFQLGDFETNGEEMAWRAKDLAPVPVDLDVGRADFLPWIAIAPEGMTWEDLGAALLDGIEKASDESANWLEAFDGRCDEDLLVTDHDKVEAAIEMIGEGSTLVRHSLLPWARAPRSADRIFESGSATTIERCVLLASALTSLGLEDRIHYYLRSPVWKQMKETLPAVEMLGAPDMGVSAWGQSTLFDSSTGRKARRTSDHFFNFGRSNKKLHAGFSTVSIVEDRIHLAISWDLAKEKARTSHRHHGVRHIDQIWKQLDSVKSDWLDAWPEGSEITGEEVPHHSQAYLTASIELAAPMPEQEENDHTILDLPGPLLELDEIFAGIPMTELRESPFHIERGLQLSMEWLLKLPPETEAHLPLAQELTFVGGLFNLETSAREDRVSITYEFDWDCREPIQPADWPAFREAVLEATDERNLQIVLRKMGD